MGLLRIVVRGAVAGAVATAAMDLVWYRRYRSGGGRDPFPTWELASSTTGFGDDAPAPARVGRLIADAAEIELDDSAAGTTNNVVHWMTGIGWGTFASAAAAVLPGPALGIGVATGVTAWGTSYALLGRLGIYKPITEYDRETLTKDLTAHLTFGAAIGAVLTIARLGRRLTR